jgi:hypothetical protein
MSGRAPGLVDPSYEATPEEIPIDAKVAPACVAPGAKVTLTVKTVPHAQLGFVAVYAGEKSGAARPWGEGYGGNDKGKSDGRGFFTYTWVLAPNTPAGWARVTLVVGTTQKQRAINVPFSVGEREAGGCGT